MPSTFVHYTASQNQQTQTDAQANKPAFHTISNPYTKSQADQTATMQMGFSAHKNTPCNAMQGVQVV